MAAVFILGLYLALASRFTATAQIAFEPDRHVIIPAERVEALVTGPEQVGRTVDRLGLGVDRWAPGPVRAAARLRAIETVRAGLRVEQTDLSNVFVLRYSGGSRRLVAPIVNDLAKDIIGAGSRSGVVRARIMTPAMDPGAPDGSPLAPLVLALLGGAFAAVVTFGARERLQDGPRSLAATEQMLGLPVVGMIPVVEGVPAGERGPLIDMPVTTPQSDYSRAFRRMLASDRAMGRIVAVCSALAGEGKSTSAISLARTAALAGRRVAFVDCDGRIRAASKALGVSGRPGLVQVMDGAVALDEALVADPHTPLMILGHSGEAEIRSFWSSDAIEGLRSVSDVLAGEFDLVVLDTPPLLALVEARNIAALAHEALLIARWRATPNGALRLAVNLLADQRIRSAIVLSFVRLAEPIQARRPAPKIRQRAVAA